MSVHTLYLAHGTDKALLFMRHQRKDVSEKAGGDDALWLPKSQITILEQAPGQAWKWAECRVLMPDWLARAKRLQAREIPGDAAYGAYGCDPDDAFDWEDDPGMGPYFEQG